MNPSNLSSLVKLARQSAVAWTRARAFAGAITFESTNTTYCLHDGVLVYRTTRGSTVSVAPSDRLELVGFLFSEDGLWALSPRWRAGSIAVLWRDSTETYTLTSPISRCEWTSTPSDPPSARRHPIVRRPHPTSITRLSPAPPV